jgi:hypothetical protein
MKLLLLTSGRAQHSTGIHRKWSASITRPVSSTRSASSRFLSRRSTLATLDAVRAWSTLLVRTRKPRRHSPFSEMEKKRLAACCIVLSEACFFCPENGRRFGCLFGFLESKNRSSGCLFGLLESKNKPPMTGKFRQIWRTDCRHFSGSSNLPKNTTHFRVLYFTKFDIRTQKWSLFNVENRLKSSSKSCFKIDLRNGVRSISFRF